MTRRQGRVGPNPRIASAGRPQHLVPFARHRHICPQHGALLEELMLRQVGRGGSALTAATGGDQLLAPWPLDLGVILIAFTPLTVTTSLPISAVAWGVRSQPEHCQLLVESMFMIIPGENRDVPAVGLEEAPKGHELLAGSSMKNLSSRWPHILVNHRKFGVA